MYFIHHSRGRGGPYTPPVTWWGKTMACLYFGGVFIACTGLSFCGWKLVISGWNILGWFPAIYK